MQKPEFKGSMTGVASDKTQAKTKDYDITSTATPQEDIQKVQYTNKNLKQTDTNFVGLNQNEDVRVSFKYILALFQKN